MIAGLGYHVSVRHSIPASVALFALLMFSEIFVSSGSAQINGAPASVTSPGFGGHAINGPRASVTSLGPDGYVPGVTFSGPVFARDGHRGNGNGQGDHHHHFVPYVPPLYYAVPLPYAVDIGATDDRDDADANAQDQDQDANYQGGPTVFDRRGSGRDSYVPPLRDVQPSHSTDRADETPAQSDPLEPTTLVFKDGHKLEVENYAIIGQTLFDMTPGHAHKVPLASLDLEATRRQNDERGVTFQLPISSQAN